MNVDQAQSAVSISAFLVAAVYGYRKLTESATGSTTVAPVGHFLVGFGFAYISLSVVAQFAPELGGMFAVLVATADILANGQALTGDITRVLQTTKTATS